ncbi:MAG TPA: DinB family protein [Acidobacteriaceae bacterium]|nr:DinB family protein [Acidobacteriaceae bacterium]
MTRAKKSATTPAVRSLGGELRIQLKSLMDGGQAHAGFDKAVKGIPEELRGVVPKGMPYSAWQLLEHMRIAQRDILEFSCNDDGSYRELKWPDDYWPSDPKPPSANAWQKSVQQIREDRETFERLVDSVDDVNLIRPFEWGDGQNLLREALLIADHNAYHVGELVLLRRVLGAWKS